MMTPSRPLPWLIIGVLALLTGCSSMVSQGLSESLAQAVMNQDDPVIVRDGAPSYLLLVDGMIEREQEDVDLLLAGAKLNLAYAALFVTEEGRAAKMGAKAKGYAERALCMTTKSSCGMAGFSYDEFIQVLSEFDKSESDSLMTVAMTWALWVQQRSGDWAAIAELPKVEAMFERVVALNPTFQQGQPHLYLGILNSLRPPAMGGKPEKARHHFEQVLVLSKGENLEAKVAYARYYARLMFDRPLHDRLLEEVIAADPHVPGLTLGNVLAQGHAQRLLDSANDYFVE